MLAESDAWRPQPSLTSALALAEAFIRLGRTRLVLLLVAFPQWVIAQFVQISAEIKLTSCRTGQTNAAADATPPRSWAWLSSPACLRQTVSWKWKHKRATNLPCKGHFLMKQYEVLPQKDSGKTT